MPVVLAPEVEANRRALFNIADTSEDLSLWIQAFLGIELPDCTVSDESDSNPMALVWECYDRMRKNNLENFSRVLAYAGRGGIKTLGASILEMLQVLHLERPTCHMAAILDQSKVSQEYVKEFIEKEWIRDFVTSSNERRINFLRYYHPRTGQSLTRMEWLTLSEAEKTEYRRIYTYVKLIICTMAGANSSHTLNLTVDEVDVVPKQNIRAYNQAKHIPDARKGRLPFTLLTSTRKSSIGLVQKEIDHAKKTGLITRHWNTIDVTEACPPTRHKPEGQHVTRYINDLLLESISEQEFEDLDEVTQKKYYARDAFEGCVTCPIFPACKGALATKQKSTSPMLKPLPAVISVFKTTDVEQAQTDLMCRKADASGLVFPRFSRLKNGRTAKEIGEIITGTELPRTFRVHDLRMLLLERGARFVAGIDWGFTHPYAYVLGAVWGKYFFVVMAFERGGLELDDKVLVSEPLKQFSPAIYADPESPSDTVTFRRKGFGMKKWDKYPGSVKMGIETVRLKLKPAVGEPELYIVSDDPGCDLLMERLERYAFILDAAGQVTDKPDDDGMDLPVALRYGVMNTYAPNGKLVLGTTADVQSDVKSTLEAIHHQAANDQWMEDMIATKLSGHPEKAVPPMQIKKSGFIFDG